MPEQYETLDKFDKGLAGLQGANNVETKPTTIQHVEYLTGAAETFTVQTVRAEYKVKIKVGWETTEEVRTGDFIVLTVMDKEGTKRIILPPKVTDTIRRQAEAVSKKTRIKKSKLAMKERMANGYVPHFQKVAS